MQTFTKKNWLPKATAAYVFFTPENLVIWMKPKHPPWQRLFLSLSFPTCHRILIPLPKFLSVRCISLHFHFMIALPDFQLLFPKSNWPITFFPHDIRRDQSKVQIWYHSPFDHFWFLLKQGEFWSCSTQPCLVCLSKGVSTTLWWLSVLQPHRFSLKSSSKPMTSATRLRHTVFPLLKTLSTLIYFSELSWRVTFHEKLYLTPPPSLHLLLAFVMFPWHMLPNDHLLHWELLSQFTNS